MAHDRAPRAVSRGAGANCSERLALFVCDARTTGTAPRGRGATCWSPWARRFGPASTRSASVSRSCVGSTGVTRPRGSHEGARPG
ncbi:MAG: hypothetical protein AVDCRST_MAG35-583 [uncultured Quadrisphaera sp.]|uniref:Uncharacterized protein n=1 Tax=uncultured Quadrisphaera sp. TaxID=904978 RepID=A0A6J4NQW7_9ACTN|nr:MAG: hypothetical protein AVDCRST_MAG35-583 [uncultured Quadrisphaera sp.]